MSLWTKLGLSLGLSREQVRLSIMRIPNMRIVAIAVVVVVSWPAVAHASKDCMTRVEARKVYRTSYLYWHGKGRCWDASPRVSDRHQQKWEPYSTTSRCRIKQQAEAGSQPGADASRAQTAKSDAR